MAATRERRANAGALMANLIKDFHEEETYNTLYGGFQEEAEDVEFGLDAVSDDGLDVDIDDEEEEELDDDIEENVDDEEEGRRRRIVRKPITYGKRKQPPAVSQKSAKKPRSSTCAVSEPGFYDGEESTDEEAESPSTSSDSRADAKFEKKQSIALSTCKRSIRDSTAAKRFETEELEQFREQRRQETGPRIRVAHRIPTQRERLAKSKHTEKANIADLEKYKRDEEENEKKRNRKAKVIRGPFDTCFISITRVLPSIAETTETHLQELVEESESLIGVKPGEKYSHSILAFRTHDIFREKFPEEKIALPEIKTCMITGKKARYRDPITKLYYYDSQALKAIHGVIYKHFITKPVLLGTPKILQFIQWCEAKYNMTRRTGDVAEIGKYDYSPNEMKSIST